MLPTWNWKEQKSLDLGNGEHWIKFVCDIEPMDQQGSTDQAQNSPKRLLTNLDSWLDVLDVPRDSFELMYRLGQRSSEFHKIKVENFAPYLLKDGMNQRVTQYVEENWYRTKGPKPKAVHILERFRYRMDKMNARETFPDEGKIVERFRIGRKDRLKQRDFFTQSAALQKTEEVSTFYHTSRSDGLSKRIVRSDDMELTEVYIGREDGLVSMQVTFGVAKKEFGPAEGKGVARDVAKVIERFADKDFTSDSQDGQGGDEDDLGDPDDLDSDYTPGRVLDTRRVLERIFDLDSDRILIKFHREGGQIFCKTAEFLAPHQTSVHVTNEKDKSGGGKEAEIDIDEIPNLSEQDVKIYLVNPRDRKPSLLELSDIYREQVVLQKAVVKRVAIIQKEMNKLLEDRMKELSAHNMEVWIFDTKRNPQVTRGRQEQENAARKREEDVMDLELDFLAPYLERFPDVNSLSKFQALGKLY